MARQPEAPVDTSEMLAPDLREECVGGRGVGVVGVGAKTHVREQMAKVLLAHVACTQDAWRAEVSWAHSAARAQ